jgi:hypothetical protein
MAAKGIAMAEPPELIPFYGDWSAYEDQIYERFLDSFVRREIYFLGCRVSAQYRPDTRGKGFSFWHVISEAPDHKTRDENERIPDLRRCERICWISWLIEMASLNAEGFSWWENRRGNETRVVIWAEHLDFAVILAKRKDYYVLKTAYSGLKTHRIHTFQKEREKFWNGQKG